MLYLNLKRVLRLRGVENHYQFVLNLGFAPATTRNLLSGQIGRISFENFERFCLALNCTPNDLLEWQPADTQANPEAQALIKLKRDHAQNFSKMLGELPMEKVEQIAEILQDLKNK